MRYRYRTKPYRHQREALRFLIKRRGVGALLMEPRTGKTKVVIDYACLVHQAGKVNRVLVLCPTTPMDVWVNEWALHGTVDDVELLVWDRKARRRVGLPEGDGLKVVILNYGALSHPQTRKHVKQLLKRWGPDLVALDESHCIKNPSAKVSRACHSIGRWVDRRIIMTGTPVTKRRRVVDVYSQWLFLNPRRFDFVPRQDGEPGRPTWDDFKAYFCRWRPHKRIKIWVRNRPTVERELVPAVHADAYVARRRDCFDLPEELPPRVVRVQLEETLPHYREVAEHMISEIEKGRYVEAGIPLTQRLRLLQLTGGVAVTSPSPDAPEVDHVRVGREKMRMLKTYLADEVFAADEKLVICAKFVDDLDAVQEVCHSLGARTYELAGRTPRRERQHGVDRFNDSVGPCAFVMQPDAGGLGIDLSSTSLMAWYSLTDSWVNFTQARDRVALSNRAVQQVFFVAVDTYDEVQLESFEADEDVSRMLLTRPRRLIGG